MMKNKHKDGEEVERRKKKKKKILEAGGPAMFILKLDQQST